MSQLFAPGSNTLSRCIIIGGFLLIFLFFGIDYTLQWSGYITGVDETIIQPVSFSHKHHVRGDGIDCRYCHTSVEVSSSAGMPSTEVCMTCHSQIWSESPLLKTVQESYRNQIPMEWNRVYSLPDYVYFNHSIHVQKGVGCVNCHGEIDTMPLTFKVRSFYMKDCLSCHRHPEYAIGEKKVKQYQINSKRITDCYTCHH